MVLRAAMGPEAAAVQPCPKNAAFTLAKKGTRVRAVRRHVAQTRNVMRPRGRSAASRRVSVSRVRPPESRARVPASAVADFVLMASVAALHALEAVTRVIKPTLVALHREPAHPLQVD